jgi:hypothetical protein
MTSGPFFLLMVSYPLQSQQGDPTQDSRGYLPDLTNSTTLGMVAEGLHSTWKLPQTYPVSNINVTVGYKWTWTGRLHAVVLQYTFAEPVLVTTSSLEALTADQSSVTMAQVLTKLPFVDVDTWPRQGMVGIHLTATKTLTDATTQLKDNRFTLTDTLIPIGE